MKHQIKNRWTDEVIFEAEIAEDVQSDMIKRHLVEKAIASGANLRWADLSGDNLREVNLCGADLCGADLSEANLNEANLCGADLCEADLNKANLRWADLNEADLYGANLNEANLNEANLRWADLSEANLCGTNLCGADLRGAKNAPLVINGLTWLVAIYGNGSMRIGCQCHKVEAWKGFCDSRISDMDDAALEFWHKHKDMLLGICDSYKH